MFKHSPFLLAGIVVIFSARNASATTSASLEQEYVQVRKIALKDPHVQDAYRKADRKLDDRMIEIDPALKPLIEQRGVQPTATPVRAGAGAEVARPAAEPALAHGRHHIVEQGETLGSIAARYKVKVVTLEKLNRITDARKLRVGQNLVIPGEAAAVAAAASPSVTPEQETPQNSSGDSGGGILEKLKNL